MTGFIKPATYSSDLEVNNNYSSNASIETPGRIFIFQGRIYQPSLSFQKFMSEPNYPSKLYFMKKLEDFMFGMSGEADLGRIASVLGTPGWYMGSTKELVMGCLVSVVSNASLSRERAAVIIQRFCRGWLCKKRYEDYKDRKRAARKIVVYLKKRIKDRKRVQDFQMELDKSVQKVKVLNELFCSEWKDCYQYRTIVIISSGKPSLGSFIYLLNPSVSIILITSNLSDNDKLFMKRLLSIHFDYSALMLKKRLILIDIPIPPYLPPTSLTKTILLNQSAINNLKMILKNSKKAFLFPTAVTREDALLSLELNIPLWATITPPKFLFESIDMASDRIDVHLDINPDLEILYLGTTIVKGGNVTFCKNDKNEILEKVDVLVQQLVELKCSGVFSFEVGFKDDIVCISKVKPYWTDERDNFMLARFAAGGNPFDLGLPARLYTKIVGLDGLFSIIISNIYISDLQNVFLETLDAYLGSNGIEIDKDGTGSLLRRHSNVHFSILATNFSAQKCSESILRALLVLKLGFVTSSNHNLVVTAKSAILDADQSLFDKGTIEDIAAAYNNCCRDLLELEQLKEQMYSSTFACQPISMDSVKLVNADYPSLDLKNIDPEYGEHKAIKKSASKSKSLPAGQYTTEEYVAILESQDRKRDASKKKTFL